MLFVVLEVACVVLALLLVRDDARWVYVVTALTGGLAIATYVVSRSLGLPQIEDDVGKWAEPLGVVALTAESLMVIGGIAAASAHRAGRL
ncbi:MAG: hypothetical protein ACXV3S_05625, partial [Kineosporiaceae bacterium]